MKIDKLLSYQQLDVQLAKEEIELRNSEECKTYFKTKKTYSDTMESIKQLDNEALRLKNSFTDESKDLENLVAEATEISNMIEKITDSGEMEYHLRCINKLYGDISRMELQLKNLLDIVSDITKKTKHLIVEGKKHREIYKTATDIFTVKKTTFDESQAETKKQLLAMQKLIEPSLFEIYKRLKDSPSTKYPYVVPFSDPCCSGCGMEIDVHQKNILKQNELIECPNCGRLIFLQK